MEIAQLQKLALSMAVLTQTQVAYRDYLGCKRQFELSAELGGVDQRILQHTQNAARSDAQGRLQEVRAAANALVSELRRYQSYSELQGAYGKILATLGVDRSAEKLSTALADIPSPAKGNAPDKVAAAQ
jgi:hypothetical protein